MAPPSPDTFAIAGNRFGLGLRADDPPPADPRADLLAQFDRFDPRPPAIAALPGSAQMAAHFRSFLEQQRLRLRRDMVAASMAAPTATATSATPPDEANRRQELRRLYTRAYGDQVNGRIAAALTTPAPFPERLVHFWSNHFSVSIEKLQTAGLAGPFEFEAIRPHIAGRFVDLLQAAARHPAMLLYLDQAQAIGPESPVADAARQRGAPRQPGLNENLGREILELHTLGVGSGYSQADVQEMARALTGWSVGGFVRGPAGQAAPDGAFVFQPGWHEPGPRQLLGQRYAGTGEAQARAMLADLAVHPATARHLATKLARHFVADVPPPALVDRLAAAHVASGGDLMAVYRVLVASPEAWAPAQPKFKTPWDWTISALRATGATATPDLRLAGALSELGQQVWRSGSPAGWDDIAASWAAPDALLRRVEVAGRLAARIGDRIDARALAPHILPGVLTAATAQAVGRAASPQQGLALLLAAPEFLRR
ncbi:DUF1800 domain-containing protein [Polymorphobacter fuscus]|uniref:DUF1800 family protein n=1 Tax=Sandarakinorhabdus fusca TaxID=1439888 RepID=A0A7C9KJJ9_9SPHN|nr:DUF1800 domain-containing protein [Polymorphobacter fuscus]KAB7644455.1 DUF1800 domain-containing protein [Polymorphobacter fuscus]MQT18380.1 DUF1800 family protein [Polymorphobacter fuscus]NJC08280.1 uncharacterized protein (DUF1800 family) [Polymorphobacter fuscus]